MYVQTHKVRSTARTHNTQEHPTKRSTAPGSEQHPPAADGSILCPLHRAWAATVRAGGRRPGKTAQEAESRASQRADTHKHAHTLPRGCDIRSSGQARSVDGHPLPQVALSAVRSICTSHAGGHSQCLRYSYSTIQYGVNTGRRFLRFSLAARCPSRKGPAPVMRVIWGLGGRRRAVHFVHFVSRRPGLADARRCPALHAPPSPRESEGRVGPRSCPPPMPPLSSGARRPGRRALGGSAEHSAVEAWGRNSPVADACPPALEPLDLSTLVRPHLRPARGYPIASFRHFFRFRSGQNPVICRALRTVQ